MKRKTITKKDHLKFIKLFSEMMNSLGAIQREYEYDANSYEWIFDTIYGKLNIFILGNYHRGEKYYSIYCRFDNYSEELSWRTGLDKCCKWNHHFRCYDSFYGTTTPETIIQEMKNRLTLLTY